jgi:hypothetical protein
VGFLGDTLRLLRPSSSEAVLVGPPLTIHVVEDTHTYEAEDGKVVWCGGYAPVDEDGHFIAESEHRTSNERVLHCKVAGVTFRPPRALANRRFAHGSQLMLRLEPSNPADPDAVAVYDSRGRVHVGYVPRTLSKKVADLIRSGTSLQARVLREFRLGSPNGKRLGIRIVIYPAGELDYSEHPRE